MPTLPTGNDGHPKVREEGFTLLEIVMVLVVICLIAAVTYPSMSRGRETLQLRTAARDLVNAVRLARETAVAEQVIMKVAVDSQARQVSVTDEVGDGARTYTLPTGMTIRGLTGAGEEVPQGPLVIRFLPNGSSEDGQILLKSERGASLRIVLDPITGLARVQAEAGGMAP